MAVINMGFIKDMKIGLFLFSFIFVLLSGAYGQNRDNLPSQFREYTNPDKVVSLDRTTTFKRAIDVLNDFSQKYRKKIILDKSDTEGNIGITVPKMHWFDAMKLILRANDLMFLKEKDLYKIVTIASQENKKGAKSASSSGAVKEGEEALASTDTYEVRINAVFFEGNRRALQEIGVDWSTISENVPNALLNEAKSGGGGGGGQGGQGQNTPQLPNSAFNSDGPFVEVNSKGAKSVSQDVFNSVVNFGEIGSSGIEVQALFSAFQADNLGEILASPTVKVQDGQDGRIQVGQDFSIKQKDIAGNVTEQFFSVGTILEVTPNVIEQNDTTFVHLDINAERSTAQPDPVSTIINKQEAETQALLLDGETTVIAGLYNTERTEVRRGIPILKDLPPWFFGLRYLFGYNSKDTQARELVILLKASLEPRISKRMSKDGFKGKFQVLREERQKMRKEMKNSQKARETNVQDGFNDLKGEDAPPKPPKMDMKEKQSKPVTKEAKPPKQMEENQQQDSSGTAGNDTAEAEKEEQKESPPVNNTEVDTKEVQLNLGADGKESDGNSPEQNKQPDSANSGKLNIDSGENQQPKNDGNKNNTVSSKTYYIVGGSFTELENANEQKAIFNSDGYNAMVLQKKDSKLKMVTYDQFDDIEKARKELSKIQGNTNNDAWLYIAK